MKKLLLAAVLMISAITASAQNLPEVKAQSIEGEEITFASLSDGRPMIISFWSTTCKPCIMELDAINDQMEDWLEEIDFQVVAVSIDDSRSVSRARALVKARGWEFTSVFDVNQDVKRAMQVSLTPQTFIVNAEGEIVGSHSGYTPGSEYTLFEELKEL